MQEELCDHDHVFNVDDFTNFIRGCYANGRYNECVHICNHSSVKSDNHIQLLRAKSLYMLFSREVLRLRKSEALISPESFHSRHIKCYTKAKEIILILSKNELTQTDTEASKMLDMAICELIAETNELCDVQVCYLCRRNLLNISSDKFDDQLNKAAKSSVKPKHESGMEMPISAPSTSQQSKKEKSKLARSHFFPHSILKKFSNAHPLPSDRQTYVDLYLRGRESDRLRSARQVTYFMLCHECEGLVSRNGEEQFPSLFFNKIYDKNDPQKSKSVLEIEYGKWLYTFCLGMIFRNLHIHRGVLYVNKDEVYKLLLQCRTCMLNVDSIPSIEDKPEIFILVNPLFASDEDMHGHGYINVVLNNTCAAVLRGISLDSGTSQEMCVHFFIIHIGVINILVKFTPAENVHISDKYLVRPEGGVYPVPPAESRRQLLPLGIWKLFQSIAQDVEMRMREYPVKLDEKLNRLPSYQPDENVKDVFGIVEGFEMDKQAIFNKGGVIPSPSPSGSKVLNLLPSDIQVRPSYHPSAVLLPKGHHLLLHYTEYLSESKRHSILFLCIGNGGIYSCNRPYIIWHHERPGLKSSVGFFFSTDDMNATEFLPDDHPKANLKGSKPTALAPFVKRLPQLLPQMLKLKGFFSLQSLLLRINMLR